MEPKLLIGGEVGCIATVDFDIIYFNTAFKL